MTQHTTQEWEAAMQRELDRINNEPDVVEDYDSYYCGNFHASVSADVRGNFEAVVFGAIDTEYLRDLTVTDLQNLKAICEALIRRSQDTANPPICQAVE